MRFYIKFINVQRQYFTSVMRNLRDGFILIVLKFLVIEHVISVSKHGRLV